MENVLHLRSENVNVTQMFLTETYRPALECGKHGNLLLQKRSTT